MLRRSFLRMCSSKQAAATAAAKPSFAEQYASTGSNVKGSNLRGRAKTSLQVSLSARKPGALLDLLTPFREAGINVNNISNRTLSLESSAKYLTIYLDVDAHIDDDRMKKVIPFLESNFPSATVIGSWQTPWYPTEAAHLDLLDQTTLAAGEDLMDDPENPHPGFHDEEYKKRRKEIAEVARSYKHGQKIAHMNYTKQETEAWTAVWDVLTPLFPSHACKQYNCMLPLFAENAGFCRTELPQLQTVSDYLEATTGFIVRPVAGLLSSRDFFNAFAFRVFYSTQYIRHHSQPLYTPEPDLVHEIVGHVPMLANPDFADFCQMIGFASIGASDAVIEELGRVYWYSVEFGLCKQPGGIRAYGAGLLSSAGELQYCLSGKAELLPWDPFVAAKKDFPITKYQPTYFVAEDFKDAQVKLQKWMDAQDRPFNLTYQPYTKKILTFDKSAASLLEDRPLFN
ncbi:biopterin-dependent phenylalanine-4-hydroxylase, putative [Bodo saltans]|uniref:phenylalanine 4-monooxygenase n=1 Tax=Bodo saltans TaxID=75058 RepID=B6DT73_BODSA|nr:phenylalanine-4-hydroxylase [Bodo saltans]CUG88310.1 biopterin-dependent phenylalanine-4-hydroxylase, putative [Bodo saltans]|eukprot:CUG88310.1 biopterin-dependent phenylalanine-4-hydroxylase, putative [Bodo saltans]